MARVQGRDPVRADPLDQGLVRVVGVDRPQVGLERRGPFELVLVAHRADVAVQGAGQADDRAGVDESGRDDGGFEDVHAVRDVRLGRGTDPFDPAVGAGDDHGVLDRCAGHGVQRSGPDRDLGRGRDGDQRG